MQIDLSFLSLRISYPFAALLATVAIFDSDGRIVCCVFAAALHEAAHIASMLAFGNASVNIDLRLLDFRIIDSGYDKRSDIKNIAVSAAGPLANMLIYLVFGATGIWRIFGEANLALGIFNAIPLCSFDGGKILYLVLLKFFCEQTCVKILNVFAFVMLVIMYTLGIGIALSTGYNFSLLIVCVYLTLLLVYKREK